MKKIICLLLILISLIACTPKPDTSIEFKIETYECDMSGYEGLDATKHMFIGTTVKELQRTMNEKGYGVFVLSRTGCSHCQMVMQYLNEVAEELDIKIYYIDGQSDEYPIVGTEDFQILYDLLYTTLPVGKDGKEIQTPELFTIVDGLITSYKVGTTWRGNEYDNDDINELKALYRKMLTPFAS